MKETFSLKFVKNSFWLYMLTYLSAPIAYITRIIISNDLTVEEVWVLYSLFGLIGMISAYSGGGVVEALKHFIPKFLVNKEFRKIKTIILISFILQITISIIIFLIIFFNKEYIATNYFQYPEITHLLYRYGIYLFGSNILQILNSIFLAFHDGFSGKIMDFLIAIITLIFSGYLAFIDEWSIISYWFIPIIALLIGVIIWWIIYLKKYYPLIASESCFIEKNFLKEFWSYSIWTFLTINSNLLLWRIDQQIVLLLNGATFAWLYANYISLWNLTSTIITPITIILTPTITTLIVQKKEKTVKTFLTKLYTYIGIFTIVLCIFLLMFWPKISRILFGYQYIESWVLLRYAAPFFIFNIFCTINFTLLASMGKIKERTLSLIWVIPIYIWLNIILIKNFNIYWAVLTTVLCKILIFYLTYRQSSPYKPKIERNPFIKNSIIALILGTILYIIETQNHFLDVENRWKALAYLTIYWIIYIWILFVINFKKIKNEYQTFSQK